MKQMIQELKKGDTILEKEPVPQIKAGKSVFVGKPLAIKETELEDIVTGVEKLLNYQKSCMERVLKCTRTGQYGFSEGLGNASKCEHGVLHEDFEFGHWEAYKSIKKITNTFSGEILATGFAKYSMPFIRYNVGDAALWSTEKYSCSRHSATIIDNSGRNENFILTPEGANMKIHSYLFKRYP